MAYRFNLSFITFSCHFNYLAGQQYRTPGFDTNLEGDSAYSQFTSGSLADLAFATGQKMAGNVSDTPPLRALRPSAPDFGGLGAIHA